MAIIRTYIFNFSTHSPSEQMAYICLVVIWQLWRPHRGSIRSNLTSLKRGGETHRTRRKKSWAGWGPKRQQSKTIWKENKEREKDKRPENGEGTKRPEKGLDPATENRSSQHTEPPIATWRREASQQTVDRETQTDRENRENARNTTSTEGDSNEGSHPN